MTHFSRLLYVVDKNISHRGIQKALELAEGQQATLTILDVVPELKLQLTFVEQIVSTDEVIERVAASRRQAILQALDALRPGSATPVVSIRGRRYLEVIHAVLREHYDLVVKLAEEPAWIGRFMSSDDMHLLRKCPCPVWLLQDTPAVKETVVLAAIDFDPQASATGETGLNEKILKLASAIATFESADLHILHAWESPIAGFVSLWSDLPDEAEKQVLDGEYAVRRNMMTACDRELKTRLGEEVYRYLSPKTRLIHGTPEEHIPAYAEKIGADIVVMGTVGRTGIPGLIIGNTAEDVLQQLRCSVVAVKPDGFVSPVSLS